MTLSLKLKEYRLTEDLCYYSNSKNDNVIAVAGTIIKASGHHDVKAGDLFFINGDSVWVTDAQEIIEEV